MTLLGDASSWTIKAEIASAVNDSNATVLQDTATCDSEGYCNFTALSLSLAGNYTLNFSLISPNLPGFLVTSEPFSIARRNLHLEPSPGPEISTQVGETLELQVTLFDSDLNTAVENPGWKVSPEQNNRIQHCLRRVEMHMCRAFLHKKWFH